jgi:flagellar protein FliS
MYSNPYSGSPEQQILSADPVELVVILFEHLTDSIRNARKHLASGDNSARALSISKAIGIIGELSRALNDEAGGDFALNVRRLYAFAVDRLVQAQIQRSAQALAEALDALLPLQEAWREINRARLEGLHAVPPEEIWSDGCGFAVNA